MDPCLYIKDDSFPLLKPSYPSAFQAMLLPLRSAALHLFPPLLIHRRHRCSNTIAVVTAPLSFPPYRGRSHSHRKNHLRSKLPQIPTQLHPCAPPIQDDCVPDEKFSDESICEARGEENREEKETKYSSLSEIKAPDETFGDESICDERGEETQDGTEAENSLLSAPDETFSDERVEDNRDGTEAGYSSLSEIKAPDRTLESGTAGFNISKLLVNVSLCLAMVVVVRTVVWVVATLRGEDSVPRRKAEVGKVVRELKLLSLEDQRKVSEIKDLVMRIRGEEEAMVDTDSGAGAGEAIIRKSLMEEIERRAGMEFQKKTEEDGKKLKKKKVEEVQKKVGDGDKAVRRKLAFSKMKVDIANRDQIKRFDGSEERNQKDSNEILPYSNDLENTMLKESLDTKTVLPSKKSTPNSIERSRSGHVEIANRDRLKGFDGLEWRNQKDSNEVLLHSNDFENTMVKESLDTKTVLPLKKSIPRSKERSRSGRSVSVSGALMTQSSSGSKELWWLKLPYVLCVYLRAGSEINNSPDDPMKRLYAMKMDPNSANSPSHVIVFQDHTDATNLCYLLESHFEAIGDFRTDIVPLPIKELEDAVLKNSLNVVVIKKSELRLYAGQPLAEVETAIRSIIQQNTDR